MSSAQFENVPEDENIIILVGPDNYYENSLNEFVDFHSSNSEWEKKSALVFARKNKLFDKTKEVQKKLGKMSRAGFTYELSKEILEID